MAKKTVTAWVGLFENEVACVDFDEDEVRLEMQIQLNSSQYKKGVARIVKAKITWEDK